MVVVILPNRPSYTMALFEKFDLFIVIVVFFILSMITRWIGLVSEMVCVLIKRPITKLKKKRCLESWDINDRRE